MSILVELNEKIRNAFLECGYEVDGKLVTLSDRPDLSQFQSNTAFIVAKKNGINPVRLSEEVIKKLENDTDLSKVFVAGPGFINVVLDNNFLSSYIERNFSKIDLTKYNCDKKKIIIDYGGPNVAKPLHVGHLRPAIIGEGLKRLSRELGNEIIGDVHLGDWGRQMGLVISEIKLRQPNLIYFDDQYSGEYPDCCPVTVEELNELYPTANCAAKNDEARMEEARNATFILQNKDHKNHRGYYELWKQLVKTSVSDLKKTYEKLDIHFDLWRGESDCNNSIPKLLEILSEKNMIETSDGATVVYVNEEGDKVDYPPVILKTKNNTVGYQTTDLATIYERLEEFDPDEIWYVVDARQKLHFDQIFRVAYRSGMVDESKKLVFIGFGTMNGTDGKPFKTRDGGVMRLSELLDITENKAFEKITNTSIEKSEKQEIACLVADASLKYADAISNRLTDYVFDIDKFTDNNGKTGPYILYSQVRIQSLLEKANVQGIKEGNLLAPSSKEELNVMLEIIKLPDVIISAYNNKSLLEIADFLFYLNSSFNNLYNNCRILDEKNIERRASLLKLIRIVGDINKKLLYIMSVRIPKRM